MVGSFLDVLFLLPAVILTELHEKPRMSKLQKKDHGRISVREITFLTTRLPFDVIFCCFLRLFPPLSQVTYVLNGSIHNISMGGILCDYIMSERSKM